MKREPLDDPAASDREDVLRAHDRRRVMRAREAPGPWRPLRLAWLLVGPGILVMLGENDAPSMLSYAATGADFGVGFFLPFVLVTFALAFLVQEMTVRLGAVSHRGHAQLIFERFGGFWGWLAMGDLIVGNFLTLATEFIGVRAGLSFFGVSPMPGVAAGLGVVTAALLSRRYWTWERLTLAFALLNLVFVPAALLAHPDPRGIAHALATWSPLPDGLSRSTLTLLLADVGATVTPWMLFFQQSATVDKGLTARDIPHARIDTALGALLAAVGAMAAIVATAPLFHHLSAAQFQGAAFAQALVPALGWTGAALFALGILEAGLVASITISTSSAYALAEVVRRRGSLNAGVRQAPLFRAVLVAGAFLAAALVLIPGAPLESIVLVINVLAVLTMPPALVFLYLLVNDREIMGRHVNGALQNVLVGGTVAALVAAGLLYGLTTVLPEGGSLP